MVGAMSPQGRWFIGAMRVVPKKPLSRVVRRLASIRSRLAVRRFARRYQVAIEDAERSIDDYESVLALFTRRLKPGLRPLDPDLNALLCPVDGSYLVGGPIGEGQLYQAKGRVFSLNALLADDQALERFRSGAYFTLYLAPKDYHRIHSPVTGVITGYTYLPGALYPVNAAAVAHVDQLFARNERLITHIETDRFGRVEVVKVGATCVGHIKVAYDQHVATNAGASVVSKSAYESPIPVERGAELGVFEMGSTVIIVVEHPIAAVPITAGAPVRLGIALGHVRSL
jgi:phosphatidylserine decarboxylase